MADTKYAVAVSLKANSERHEGVGFLGRTVGSALSGALLELFCRRGQKSGKKDKQQFTAPTSYRGMRFTWVAHPRFGLPHCGKQQFIVSSKQKTHTGCPVGHHSMCVFFNSKAERGMISRASWWCRLQQMPFLLIHRNAEYLPPARTAYTQCHRNLCQ